MITAKVTVELAFTPGSLSQFVTDTDASWWSGNIDRGALHAAVSRQVEAAIALHPLSQYVTVTMCKARTDSEVVMPIAGS